MTSSTQTHRLFIVLWVLFASAIVAPIAGQSSQSGEKASLEVIRRTFPELTNRLTVGSIGKEQNLDVFEQHVQEDKLVVKGSSPVAICRGIYDFVRNNEYGISSWTGNRLQLPGDLGSAQTRRVVSPFQHHYYFNVVTYGYSLAYWDWERWEKEIDWMALHGIDMPLALVANEAISARVWKKLGLTDREIADYFVGPAHLPWMRMGNISGIDGPLPASWHTQQVALQHKILERMRSLGMKPICPGFAGFVPQAMKRLYPELTITETSWGGAFHNWMLSPEDELFHTIGKLFIEEWEKEFGENDYYIVDSFNEMEIPFPPHNRPERYELLASYGEKVYRSIRDGNPNATWVMQGWMFGYQREIWDFKTLQALVSKVPDDKMLLLDLAVDYNRCFWHNDVNWEFYKGFYNKPWVYSVIPNMGGKSGMTGVLSFYANGHLEALHSANKGRLVGFGMAPEGIENNEVIYELITDAGWSAQEMDVNRWLRNYSVCRYGTYSPGLDGFWNGMLQSVYGTFTDHPRYNWQLRPGLTRKGTINANDAFYKGIETLASSLSKIPANDLLALDFREWAVAYLGGKTELLSQQIEDAYQLGDAKEAQRLEELFVRLMRGMDVLLSNHPTKDLQRWIDFARKHGGDNRELADYYEKNARRIVSIWGPPVDDYSARIWSGLIRDYYLPRWQHYFEQHRTKQKFDFPGWERNWVEATQGVSAPDTCTNYIALATSLIEEASAIKSGELNNRRNIVGSWSEADVTTSPTTLEWSVSASDIKALKGIGIQQTKRGAAIEILQLFLVADGKKYSLAENIPPVTDSFIFPVKLPDSFTANNECKLQVVLKNSRNRLSEGSIFQLKMNN